MLVTTQHNAYFTKYLQLKNVLAANGKILPQVVTECIAKLGFSGGIK
jgi:hypothetical protein